MIHIETIVVLIRPLQRIGYLHVLASSRIRIGEQGARLHVHILALHNARESVQRNRSHIRTVIRLRSDTPIRKSNDGRLDRERSVIIAEVKVPSRHLFHTCDRRMIAHTHIVGAFNRIVTVRLHHDSIHSDSDRRAMLLPIVYEGRVTQRDISLTQRDNFRRNRQRTIYQRNIIITGIDINRELIINRPHVLQGSGIFRCEGLALRHAVARNGLDAMAGEHRTVVRLFARRGLDHDRTFRDGEVGAIRIEHHPTVFLRGYDDLSGVTRVDIVHILKSVEHLVHEAIPHLNRTGRSMLTSIIEISSI